MSFCACMEARGITPDLYHPPVPTLNIRHLPILKPRGSVPLLWICSSVTPCHLLLLRVSQGHECVPHGTRINDSAHLLLCVLCVGKHEEKQNEGGTVTKSFNKRIQ